MLHVSSLHDVSNSIGRVAFIGDYLPRKCGIATFTHDLFHAVSDTFPDKKFAVAAVNDNADGYDYPREVAFEFPEKDPMAYYRVADFISNGGFDLVCVQHEYGIYGGPCGALLLQLLRSIKVPIVTTLHTILQEPNLDQRRILNSIISVSAFVVTMAQKGSQLLRDVFNAETEKVRIIEHGIPEMEYPDTELFKKELGFGGKKVVLTFGLLSPNKGIESAIDAMALVKTRMREPEKLLYVVLGQTHPHIIRDHGEMYRHGLQHQAKQLGVQDNVTFVDAFVDLPLLKKYIAACDIYLTPYLNESQITSGTLSYAFGMGSAVVSTPYWHAAELLADGRGRIVPFKDSEAMAGAIAGLLDDDTQRVALKRQAFEHGRTMTWSNTARKYWLTFEDALKKASTKRSIHVYEPSRTTLPDVPLEHLIRMTDETGLIQHARFTTPDRNHGYSIDDIARALMLVSRLHGNAFKFPPGGDRCKDIYMAFIAHAQNPKTKRFRNFMSYDRKWLEEEGSEDSHGRTLRGLGAAFKYDVCSDTAMSLFLESFMLVKGFTSPRSWAFAALGMTNFLIRQQDAAMAALRTELLDRLVDIYDRVADPKEDWLWFEETATYDNAVLSQALIVAGDSAGHARAVEVGLGSLEWLFEHQTTGDHIFLPIGNCGWSKKGAGPARAHFDQQPLEAGAMVQACVAADRVAPGRGWLQRARCAFDWFMGRNVVGKALYDPATQGCCDGLHEHRVNQNQGAESLVSFVLALVELKREEYSQTMPLTPCDGFTSKTGRFE